MFGLMFRIILCRKATLAGLLVLPDNGTCEWFAHEHFGSVSGTARATRAATIEFAADPGTVFRSVSRHAG